LPLADAISYTLQIAEALAHASQRNVVHRDIKPSNIIVTEEGRAKLVDMGLARVHVKSAEEDLTASGVTLGTFDYISPEQARDPRTADVRSDMYSLGCTLYYMLTGRPPFPHGTVLQKLLQHQGDDAPDPRQYNDDLPQEVVTLMSRLMAKDPRKRFQQPSELIGELLILAERLDLRPVSSSQFWLARRGEDSPWWERHLPWAAPVAALLLIALGLAWFDAAGRRGAESVALSPGKPSARGNAESATPKGRSNERSPGAKTPSAPSSKTGSVDQGAGAATDGGQNSADPSTPTPSTSGNPKNSASGLGPLGSSGSNAEPTGPGSPTTRPSPGGASWLDLERLRANPDGNRGVPAAGGAKLSEPDVSGGISAGRDLSAELSVITAADNGRVGAIGAETIETSSTGIGATLSGPAGTADPIPRAGNDSATGQAATGAENERPVATGGVSIVGAAGADRRQFANLKAACASAKNNDVIELQYTGRRDEEPIELTNLKLTIRAAGGHRPVVRFRPTRVGAAGVGAPSMISLAGGRLNLVNLGLELDIPRDAPAEGWSLVELRRAEELRLEKCTLTVRNATDTGHDYFANVAIFQLKAAPGSESMRMTEPAPVHPVELELIDCVARGEAALVRTADMQPLSLQWKNGFLSTTGPLLQGTGAASAAPAGQRNQISLSHVTAIVRGGLVRLTATNDAPYQLATEAKCDNSILVTRDAPLIEQMGPQRVSVLESQFTWSGDRNFCQGFSTFWKLVDLSNPTVPRSLAASSWQARWGKGDTLLDRAASALRPENFALSGTDHDSAHRYESTDGRNAGMELLDLPKTPE
jgi:serine/threonine-protein kinase